MTAPDGMCYGRVKDAASYETVTHSPPCAGQRYPVRRGGTRRCRPTSGTVVCSEFRGNGKAAIHHPARGGDGGFGADAPGIPRLARRGSGRWGVSRRARRGSFAGCGQRVFRPLRRATGALPLDPRIFSRKNSVKAFYFWVRWLFSGGTQLPCRLVISGREPPGKRRTILPRMVTIRPVHTPIAGIDQRLRPIPSKTIIPLPCQLPPPLQLVLPVHTVGRPAPSGTACHGQKG